MISPFSITVYNKAFQKRGTVGDPLSLTVTVRHNQQGNSQLMVSSLHPRITDLLTPGARVWIKYLGDHLTSGVVNSWTVKGPASSAVFTFQIRDDWHLFSRLLAWPSPSLAIDAQTVVEQDVRSGPAETVLKGYVAANKGRSVPSVSVGTDLGRGSSISTGLRFKPLTDTVIPAVDAAGLGTSVMQSGSGLLMDVYVPRVYPRILTERSGIIVDWDAHHNAMDATDVVAGGKGEGTARLLTTQSSSALRSEYGYSVEVFKDDTSVDDLTGLNASAQNALAENAPKSGLSVTLSETSVFRYDPTGTTGIRIGDTVTVAIAPHINVTDIIRECTLNWSADNGLTVAPHVGERNDTSLSLKKSVAAIARGLRNLSGR